MLKKLLLVVAAVATSSVSFQASAEEVGKIAFGSCNKSHLDQSYWETVAAEKPDLWLWTGDVIYADLLPNHIKARRYNELKQNPFYAKFAASHEILGVWDDHDFGGNNFGMLSNYLGRKQSKKLFLDFIGTDPGASVFDHEGIYQRVERTVAGVSVEIILLDLRYFKINMDLAGGQLMGLEQWNWLETVLADRTRNADITLVVSSSQALPIDQPKESWSDYPAEKRRLLDALKASRRNPIILSGDRHYSEVSLLEGITEITSSGLTHTKPLHKVSGNVYRVGQPVLVKNFAVLEISRDTHDQPQAVIKIRSLADGAVLLEQGVPLK